MPSQDQLDQPHQGCKDSGHSFDQDFQRLLALPRERTLNGDLSKVRDVCEWISHTVTWNGSSYQSGKVPCLSDILHFAGESFNASRQTPARGATEAFGERTEAALPVRGFSAAVSILHLYAAENRRAARLILQYAREWQPLEESILPTSKIYWDLIELIEIVSLRILGGDRKFMLLLFLRCLRTYEGRLEPAFALNAVAQIVTVAQFAHTSSLFEDVALRDWESALPVDILLLILSLYFPDETLPANEIGEETIEKLQWSANEYTRLAANYIYGADPAALSGLMYPYNTGDAASGTAQPTSPSADLDALCAIIALRKSAFMDPAVFEKRFVDVEQPSRLLFQALRNYEAVEVTTSPVITKLQGLIVNTFLVLSMYINVRTMQGRRDIAERLWRVLEEAFRIVVDDPHPYPDAVRVAVCKFIRAYSRSVYTLRVQFNPTLLTPAVGVKLPQAFVDMLSPTSSPELCEEGVGIISNLVLEFSWMQAAMIEVGAIRKMCELMSTTPSVTIKRAVLSGLRNALYSSTPNEKFEIMTCELLYEYKQLSTIAFSDDPETALPAYQLLGNIQAPNSIDVLLRLLSAESRDRTEQECTDEFVRRLIASELDKTHAELQFAAAQVFHNWAANWEGHSKLRRYTADIMKAQIEVMRGPKLHPQLVISASQAIKDLAQTCSSSRDIGIPELLDEAIDSIRQLTPTNDLAMVNSLADAEHTIAFYQHNHTSDS